MGKRCLQAEILTAVKEQKVPNAFEILEKLLVANNGGDGFFVGDAVSTRHSILQSVRIKMKAFFV